VQCVLVGPFLWYMLGRMHGAGAEGRDAGLVRRNLLGGGDRRPGLRHLVRGEVVALLRGGGRLHLAVVLHRLREMLVRVATEESRGRA
jgi:hypothetical protein